MATSRLAGMRFGQVHAAQLKANAKMFLKGTQTEMTLEINRDHLKWRYSTRHKFMMTQTVNVSSVL